MWSIYSGAVIVNVLKYTRAPIGNEINQCQFGVSSLFVTGHSIYALKFGAGQKTTSAMARWHWLDGRPWGFIKYAIYSIIPRLSGTFFCT